MQAGMLDVRNALRCETDDSLVIKVGWLLVVVLSSPRKETLYLDASRVMHVS